MKVKRHNLAKIIIFILDSVRDMSACPYARIHLIGGGGQNTLEEDSWTELLEVLDALRSVYVCKKAT